MPLTPSAKKAARQNRRRRKRNLAYKRKAKKLEKEIRFLLKQKKIEETKKLLPLLFKIFDKATKEKIFKKNKAARKKSRFSRLLAKHKS